MKAHNAKIKGNEGPEGYKLQNEAGPGADKFFVFFLRKRTVFGNLRGGPEADPQKLKRKEIKTHQAKMQGNEGPQGQNEGK